jgi:hypothetical protein
MMTRKPAFVAIACVVVCRAAWAQAPDHPDDQQANCPAPEGSEVTCPPPPPPPQPPTPEPLPPAPPPAVNPAATPEVYQPTPQWYDDLGYSLSIGGGVSDFSHSVMRNTTSTGGSWDVRLSIGTRSYFTLEGSYIGSAQGIQRVGLSNGATLFGNGVQVALRINTNTHYWLQPFFYGGAAYRFYSVSTSNGNLSDVATSTNVFELPVGIGLAAYFGYIAVDLRGEYRFTWSGDDLIPELVNTSGGLDRWNFSANIGYEF